MPDYTVCQFCAGRPTHVAAQSTDGGVTVTLVLVCDAHAEGWNEGGDWEAPIYPLSTANERSPNYNYKAKLALRAFAYQNYADYLEECKRRYPGGSLST